MKQIKQKHSNRIAIVLIFSVFIFITTSCTANSIIDSGSDEKPQGATGTIVVSSSSDEYYSLAQKIAREENLQLIEDFSDVFSYRPKFIILVASPAYLTAEKLSAIGHLYQENDYYPALGIISGSTLESAQQLWQRREDAKADERYAAGDVEILQLVYEPTIFEIGDTATKKMPLNRANLLDALKQADYFYWSRHTGPKDWSWNEESGNWTEKDQMRARDIPPLKPVVIYSLTCSSFRPWLDESMPFGFTDNGAAAFLGFVNTPNMNVVMKHGSYLPGITTWREFPLGLVAQVQNKTATQTVFRSPQLFMLGDPRIHLSQEQPYRILSDTVDENGRRNIEGISNNMGILSLQIEDGAQYEFISVQGLTSSSDNDVFFNGKLQTLHLGTDTYILFPHDGGNFRIELNRHAPWYWHVLDALGDAFDFTWVVFWLNTYIDSSPRIDIISIPAFILILLFKTVKQKNQLREYRKIFLFAFLIVLLRLAYYLWRFDEYSVSTALISTTPLQLLSGYLGVFSCISAGLIIMKDSQKRAMKIFGLLFAVLRTFWLTAFHLMFITLLNTLTPITRNTEPWLLRYDLACLPVIVLACEVVAVLFFYRRISSQKLQQ